MWRAALFALALAAAQGCSRAGDPAPGAAPPWQRAWRVHAFECPACSAADRAWLDARRGVTVSFEPQRFVNPLYEDCDRGADYADIRPRSRAEAADFLGRGRLPALSSRTPLAGAVRCAEASGPPNTVARVVIDGQRAYLLHESGAVVELR